MDTNRLSKQTLQYKPKERRNVGRPRKRWRDQLHLEDQGTGNTPKPSWTWWWWWWWWWCIFSRARNQEPKTRTYSSMIYYDDFPHYFIQNVSRDGGWRSARCYSSLPWVGVHAFWCNLKCFFSTRRRASHPTSTLFITFRNSLAQKSDGKWLSAFVI